MIEPQPELLSNGDILAPVTQDDGSKRMVRLAAGTREHATWLVQIQRERRLAEQQSPPPPPPPRPPVQPIQSTVAIPWGKIVGGLAAALVAVWFTGVLDKPLAGIGLNKNPCIVTAIGGSTLCGDEAKAWCDTTDGLRALDRSGSSDSQATCDEIRSR